MHWLKQNANWLKWLLAVVLMAAVIHFNREGLQKLSTRQIAWPCFAAAVAARFSGLCLSFTRWWLLVTGINLPLRWRDAFRLGMFGEACSFVMPGAAGGDLVKAALLAKDHPERVASAAATVLLDRILGLWALFVAGAVASLVPVTTPLASDMQWAVRVLWLGSVGGLVGLSLLLTPAFTNSRLMKWATTWRGIGGIVNELTHSVGFYQRTPATIFGAGILSLLGHIGFLSAFYFGAIALHGDRPIPGYVDHLVGLPLPEAISAAVPAPAGLGALEAAVAWFYEQHQIRLDSESSTAILEEARANGLGTALIYRMSTLILGVIGIGVFFRGRRLRPDVDVTGSSGS